MKAKPPFLVAVIEEGTIIPLRFPDAIQVDLRAAKKLAEKYVDNALPYNVVAVFKLVQLGYAALDGEGGTYWKETTS